VVSRKVGPCHEAGTRLHSELCIQWRRGYFAVSFAATAGALLLISVDQLRHRDVTEPALKAAFIYNICEVTVRGQPMWYPGRAAARDVRAHDDAVRAALRATRPKDRSAGGS